MPRIGTSNDHKIIHHFTWSLPDNPLPGGIRDGRDLLASETGMQPWVERWRRGETIAGNTRDFDKRTRKFFETLGAQSIIAVPVFVDDQWWGVVGFDACKGEREWVQSEIDTFKIFSVSYWARQLQLRSTNGSSPMQIALSKTARRFFIVLGLSRHFRFYLFHTISATTDTRLRRCCKSPRVGMN